MSLNALPINPERRDPGQIKNKASIGLPNVDNVSANEFIDVILDLVKSDINQEASYNITNSLSSRIVPLVQFKDSGSFNIVFSFISPLSKALETAHLIVTYKAIDGTEGRVEYQLLSPGGTYFSGTHIKFFESKIRTNKLCNVLLDIENLSSSSIPTLRLNIFQFTSGVSKLDPTLVNNDIYYSPINFNQIYSISCLKSSNSISSTESTNNLGLNIYTDSAEKITDMENSSYQEEDHLNFPKINGVEFTGTYGSTLKGKSLRNIIVPSRHKSRLQKDSGYHDWETLYSYPKNNLTLDPNSGRFHRSIQAGFSDNYGLSKISGYIPLPKSESVSLSENMISTLGIWANALSSDNTEVVPVGAVKDLIYYLSKTLTSINKNGILTSEKRIFQFVNPKESSWVVSSSSSTISFYIHNYVEIQGDGGITEYNYNYSPLSISSENLSEREDDESSVESKSISFDSVKNLWKVTLNIAENFGKIDKLTRIYIMSDFGEQLTCDIRQSAPAEIYGFRVNGELFLSAEEYPLKFSGDAFFDLHLDIYPVEIKRGEEYRLDDYISISGNTWVDILETRPNGIQRLYLSASENPSIITERLENIILSFSKNSIDRDLKIVINQEIKKSFIYINDDTTQEDLTLPPVPKDLVESVLKLQTNYPSVISTDSSDWILLNNQQNPTSYSPGTSYIPLRIEKNPLSTDRTGIIKVLSNSKVRNIIVRQKAGEKYLLIDKSSQDKELIFSQSILTKEISIRTNTVWDINESLSWLSSDIQSGGIEGEATETILTLTCSPNSDNSNRTGSISIISGSLSRTIGIKQFYTGSIAINPEKETIEFTGEGNIVNPQQVSVYSNCAYSIEIEEGSNWLLSSATIVGQTSESEILTSFSVYPIETYSQATRREARLKLTSVLDLNIYCFIKVIQFGNITLSVSESNISFNSTNSPLKTITVLANSGEWNSYCSASWLSYTNESTSTSMLIQPADNIGNLSRNTSIRIYTRSLHSDDIFLDPIWSEVSIMQESPVKTVNSYYTNPRILLKNLTTVISQYGGTIPLDCFLDKEVVTVIDSISKKTIYTDLDVTDNVTYVLLSGTATISGKNLIVAKNSTDLYKNYLISGVISGNGMNITFETTLTQEPRTTVVWTKYTNIGVYLLNTWNNKIKYRETTVEMVISATKETHSTSAEGIDTIINSVPVSGNEIEGLDLVWLTKAEQIDDSYSILDNDFKLKIFENYKGEDQTSNLKVIIPYKNSLGESKTEEYIKTIVQEKNPIIEIVILTNPVWLPKEPGISQKIKIISNGSWYIPNTSRGTMSVSPNVGVAGTTEISVTGTYPNLNPVTPLTEIFQISPLSGHPKNLRIYQKPWGPYDNVSTTAGDYQGLNLPTSIPLSGIGGESISFEFFVNSNRVGWSLDLSSTSKAATITTTAVTDYISRVDIIPTLSNESTEVDLNFGSLLLKRGSIIIQTIPLVQLKDNPNISLSKSSILFENTQGNSTTFQITSNSTWTISSNPKVTLTPATGTGNQLITISTNQGGERSPSSEIINSLGSIQISINGKSITRTIDLQQKSVFAYSTDSSTSTAILSELYLSATHGQASTIYIKSNSTWSIPENWDTSKFSVSPKTGGTGTTPVVITPLNDRFDVSVNKNFGVISIDCGSTGVPSPQILLYQNGAGGITSVPSSITLAEEHDQPATVFTLISNLSWNLSLSSGLGYSGANFSINTASGLPTTSGGISISVSPTTSNPYAVNFKIGTITCSFGSDIVKTIDVYQAAVQPLLSSSTNTIVISPKLNSQVPFSFSTNSNWIGLSSIDARTGVSNSGILSSYYSINKQSGTYLENSAILTTTYEWTASSNWDVGSFTLQSSPINSSELTFNIIQRRAYPKVVISTDSLLLSKASGSWLQFTVNTAPYPLTSSIITMGTTINNVDNFTLQLVSSSNYLYTYRVTAARNGSDFGWFPLPSDMGVSLGYITFKVADNSFAYPGLPVIDATGVIQITQRNS